jgi:hypothetical protein
MTSASVTKEELILMTSASKRKNIVTSASLIKENKLMTLAFKRKNWRPRPLSSRRKTHDLCLSCFTRL